MTDRPSVDDAILMPIMGDDVSITVSKVPDDQPRSAEGIWTILDQHGDEHAVERDGADWVIVHPGML